LFLKDDLWIVVDHIVGDGSHALRLHWLAGDFPSSYEASAGRLTLNTGAGDFFIEILDSHGCPVPGDVVVGRVDPPRGWLSRYYGEKTPVPSLAVETRRVLPATFVTVLSGGTRADVYVAGDAWTIDAGDRRMVFQLTDGLFSNVAADLRALSNPSSVLDACTS